MKIGGKGQLVQDKEYSHLHILLLLLTLKVTLELKMFPIEIQDALFKI